MLPSAPGRWALGGTFETDPDELVAEVSSHDIQGSGKDALRKNVVVDTLPASARFKNALLMLLQPLEQADISVGFAGTRQDEMNML